ncbi:hypothetical protein SCHAM137S_01102 [Streptomyces chartreusis]
MALHLRGTLLPDGTVRDLWILFPHGNSPAVRLG